MSSIKKKLGVLVLFSGILIASVGIFLWFFRDQPLLSPITSSTIFEFLTNQPPPTTEKKIVYGFLPYWNINQVVLQPELTHLAYFSLAIGPNGKILTSTGGLENQGYTQLKSDNVLSLMNQAKKNHQKIEIVFEQMSADDTSAFLLNSSAQQHFFDAMDAVLLAYPIDGINIDIEYGGTVTQGLRDHFSSFIQDLHGHLQKKYNNVSLSIDLASYAAHDNSIWDLAEISKNVDFIVVMAYDFHRRSSIIVGPIAPLFSGDNFWDSNITQYLRQFLQVVPKSKLVLGIPFYGYEWRTTSKNADARTYPDTGVTATYDHIQDLFAHKDEWHVEEHWNEDALSPYLSYKKNGETFVVYYENSRSLSYKLDLVNQLELHGIAIWALGYEKDSRELWDVIKNKL